MSHAEIARRVGVNRHTVINWRARYETSGRTVLDDRPRSRRPRRVDRGKIIAATLMLPPSKLGVTHWSSRLLAARLGIDHATFARGLYLAPPHNAIVLCLDEKSQIQVLDRTAPMLPTSTGSKIEVSA